MKITTIALTAGVYYLIAQNKIKQAEAAITPSVTPELPAVSVLSITSTKQATVDSISVAPTTSTALPVNALITNIDPIYHVPVQKPVEPINPSGPTSVIVPTIVLTPLPPVQTQILPPQQTVAPVVSQPNMQQPLPAINTTVTTTITTPPISGLLYVIKPDVLIGILPLILTYNQLIGAYAGSINNLYTLYDVLKPIPALESAKLISQYSTPEFASVFLYYDNLIKMQLQYYKDRQAILNERAAKGKGASGNDRIFQVLNVIIDNQKYGSLTTGEKNNYIPIELFSLPSGQVSSLDIVKLSNIGGTYAGPYYVPSDGRSHTYHILSKDYNYPQGYIFGFINTIDNAVVEFAFTNLYGEYDARQVPGYFEYATKLFLRTMCRKTFMEITNYAKIPAWSTVRISGRIVSNPIYEIVAEILKDDINFQDVNIDNLIMAKKYDVPVTAVSALISSYRKYCVQHPNEKLSIQTWYAEHVMEPPLSFPQRSADYPAYAAKIDEAMLRNYKILTGTQHFANTLDTAQAFGSPFMQKGFNYYSAASFYTHR